MPRNHNWCEATYAIRLIRTPCPVKMNLRPGGDDRTGTVWLAGWLRISGFGHLGGPIMGRSIWVVLGLQYPMYIFAKHGGIPTSEGYIPTSEGHILTKQANLRPYFARTGTQNTINGRFLNTNPLFWTLFPIISIPRLIYPRARVDISRLGSSRVTGLVQFGSPLFLILLAFWGVISLLFVAYDTL